MDYNRKRKTLKEKLSYYINCSPSNSREKLAQSFALLIVSLPVAFVELLKRILKRIKRIPSRIPIWIERTKNKVMKLNEKGRLILAAVCFVLVFGYVVISTAAPEATTYTIDSAKPSINEKNEVFVIDVLNVGDEEWYSCNLQTEEGKMENVLFPAKYTTIHKHNDSEQIPTVKVEEWLTGNRTFSLHVPASVHMNYPNGENKIEEEKNVDKKVEEPNWNTIMIPLKPKDNVLYD